MWVNFLQRNLSLHVVETVGGFSQVTPSCVHGGSAAASALGVTSTVRKSNYNKLETGLN